MKKFLLILVLFLAMFDASAQVQTVTVTLTVTNTPITNSAITVNGSTRIWTNLPPNAPSGFISTTNSIGGSATNMFNAFAANPFTGTRLGFSSSNVVTLLGSPGQAMTVTVLSNWLTFSYATNYSTNQTPVLIPVSAYQSSIAQTNVATQIVAGVNSYAQNTFVLLVIPHNLASDVFSNGVISGAVLTNGTLTNCTAYALTNINAVLTNGTLTNCFDYGETSVNPVTTNLVNYGNAISSRGSAVGAEQYGFSSTATFGNSTAVGTASDAAALDASAFGAASYASSNYSTAIGALSEATNTRSTALGTGALAFGVNGLAIGYASGNTGFQSTVIGAQATDNGHTNSTALGFSAACTLDNQVMLGASGISVFVNNNATVLGNLTVAGVQTNGTFDGTNFQRGSMSFQQVANTSLANGNNADVVTGKAVYLKVSGPSGAFGLVGLVGGNDGRHLIIQNSTGQVLTILNESGLESTTVNRILTGTAGTLTITNNPGFAELIYDAALSRWCVVSVSP